MTVLLLALALAALLVARYLASRSRFLPGEVIYSDIDEQRCGETLVSHRYGLVGRPDYIVRSPAGPIPIEVKSRACGSHGPYPGEKAQLFAYCLLIEDTMHLPVRSGVLRFRDRQWTVPFGDRERRFILSTLDEMRVAENDESARSHTIAARCRGCGFRATDVCGQEL